MTTRRCLSFLGLPFSTRYEQASTLIREKAVQARRNDDNDRQVLLSGIKAFLARNLRRTCRCGVAIKRRALACHICKLSSGLILFCLLAASSQAGEVKLAWDADTTPGVTNYVLRVTAGTNTARFNLGTNLTATVQATNSLVYSVQVTSQKLGVESDPPLTLAFEVPKGPTNLRTLVLEASFDLTGTNWMVIGNIRLRAP